MAAARSPAMAARSPAMAARSPAATQSPGIVPHPKDCSLCTDVDNEH